MPTNSQRNAVRADLDSNDDQLSNAKVDDLYTRVTEMYPTNSLAVEAGVRVMAINQLLAGAAKRTDYKQNQSTEALGQLFDHLFRLRAIHAADLETALTSGASGVAARWGGLRPTKTRLVQLPDDFQLNYGVSHYWDVSRLEG